MQQVRGNDGWVRTPGLSKEAVKMLGSPFVIATWKLPDLVNLVPVEPRAAS